MKELEKGRTLLDYKIPKEATFNLGLRTACGCCCPTHLREMNVWTPDGVYHLVEMKESESVLQFKQNIHLKLGIPPDKQRLYHQKILL